MYALNSHDYKDILDVVYLCNSQLEPGDLQKTILHALHRTFGSSGEIFYLGTQDLKGLDLTNIVSFNLDEYYTTLYAQHYWRFDPHMQKALHSKSVVFKSDDILSPSQWFKLDYYNEFLRPQNKKQELDICLRSRDRLFGMVTLLRSRQQRDFQESDIIRAKVLAPHLTNAIHNAILCMRIDEERKLLQTGTEFLPQGVILLDCELRPVYSNSEAKRICLSLSGEREEPANGLKSEEFPLPPEIVQDCLVLKKRLQSWNEIDPLQHQRFISTEHNKTFYIGCFVIWQHSEISSALYFLISLEDLSKSHKVSEDIVKRQYHLTNREMDIMQRAADGLTNNEIADNLFISTITVETHLSNIFRKTGVRNRTELANLAKSAWKLPREKQRGHIGNGSLE